MSQEGVIQTIAKEPFSDGWTAAKSASAEAVTGRKLTFNICFFI
jgi:hypothetical protein